ncbi:adenylosuccinate lyase family protein [Roseomonas aerophila]|uniref:Adenylosuccinate lyase family protein n=1 Tax=Teichococcus aerophilus TaxID=1224513 RepID=A0ABR7RQI8_9PROT|nr:adenylosuccinate lyase family protein [Pseudoroseomonas aerophila]
MTFAALDSALLGPLSATEEMRAVFADEARLRAMLTVEAALARAQAGLGLVPATLPAAIAATAPLDAAAIGRRTALSAVPTIPFVKDVQEQLPAELERAFHKGATTQDIMDTALVLQLRPALDLVAAELDAILAGLSRLAAAHRATPCVGRTYAQHAAPLTFGYKVAVWLAGVSEVAERLPEIRRRVLVASLAGPVGTLAALGKDGPAVLEAFAAELGLGSTSIAWHTRRARMAETGAWLATVLGAVAKMATDIAHLCSTEVGEVAEPYIPGRGGSSAMPHKRNPVSCTVILAAQAASRGYAGILADSMVALHERPAGAWHAEWHALPPLFGLVSGALREARGLAEGLTVDAERMRANIDLTQGLLFADAAASRLGGTMGREAAHALVEHAAGEVRRSGRPLRAVLEAMPEAQGVALDPAFDLTPSIAAAGPWVDRAIQEADAVRALLATPAG